jgi:hypothetical protein
MECRSFIQKDAGYMAFSLQFWSRVTVAVLLVLQIRHGCLLCCGEGAEVVVEAGW